MYTCWQSQSFSEHLGPAGPGGQFKLVGGLVKTKLQLAVFLLTWSLGAQSNRGAITGTVSDSAGALIPGVQVILTNSETGAKSETVSTGTGNYSLLQLPVGTYTLTVERAGFSK